MNIYSLFKFQATHNLNMKINLLFKPLPTLSPVPKGNPQVLVSILSNLFSSFLYLYIIEAFCDLFVCIHEIKLYVLLCNSMPWGSFHVSS